MWGPNHKHKWLRWNKSLTPTNPRTFIQDMYTATFSRFLCVLEIRYRDQPLLFSCSVVSESSKLHGLQHARLPCPSPSPGVCSNLCPLSWWWHPAISSSAVSYCPQSFQASVSFPVSWLFASGGQSIEASASVLPMNIQSWFPLGLTSLISLLSNGLSRVFSTTSLKALILWGSAFFRGHLSHPYMSTGKTIAFTIRTFVDQVMSLLLKMWKKIAFTEEDL